MKNVPEKPELTPELEVKLSELDILRQALDESKAKTAQYYDQLLRLRAEFDNFRKRAEREKMEARNWGKQEVLLQLVSLVDVFEQALTQAHTAKDLKHVVKGVEMLHKNFTQFLKAEGLEPIDLLGKPLDPSRAEVIAQQEVEDDRVGKVIEEFQKGYIFHGHVLRPSRVSVGVAKKAQNTKKTENEAQEELKEKPQEEPQEESKE